MNTEVISCRSCDHKYRRDKYCHECIDGSCYQNTKEQTELKESLDNISESLMREELLITCQGMDIDKLDKILALHKQHCSRYFKELFLEELEMHIMCNEDDWSRRPQATFTNFKERLNLTK